MGNITTPWNVLSYETNKDLNVRPETIIILKENIGSKILNAAHRNILSDIFPKTRETKEK